jgi:DNA mismatch repair protein MutS2
MKKGENHTDIKTIIEWYTSVLPLLIQYQDFLSDVDVIAAKAKYANRTGIMPQIDNRRLYFRDAYHPILKTTNRKGNYASANHWTANRKQIIVTGPNAGGKTTLKTVDYSN